MCIRDRVITEAMECGLPVVSFRTDGPSEIIRDGQDGILIDNYRKDQFADALERLMLSLIHIFLF